MIVLVKSKLKSLTRFLSLFLICYCLTSFFYPVFASGDDVDVEYPDDIPNVTTTPTPMPHGNPEDGFSDSYRRNMFQTKLYKYTVRFFNEIGMVYNAGDLSYLVGKYCDLHDLGGNCSMDDFYSWIHHCENSWYLWGNDDGDLLFMEYDPPFHVNPAGYHVITDIFEYWKNREDPDDDIAVSVNDSDKHPGHTQFPFIDKNYHVETKLNRSYYFVQSVEDTILDWIIADTELYNDSDQIVYDATRNNCGIAFGGPQFTSWPSYSKPYQGTFLSSDVTDSPITVYVNYPQNSNNTNDSVIFAEAKVISGNLCLTPKTMFNGVFNSNVNSAYPWLTSISNKTSHQVSRFYLQFFYNGYQGDKDVYTSDNESIWGVLTPLDRKYGDYATVYNFFWGNTLIISGDHLYLYWYGSWYDLGVNTDPFGTNIKFKPKSTRDLNDIIYNIFNQYNYYVSDNGVSGNGIDYSYDLRTIIELLRNINNKLNQFSDKFEEYSSSVVAKLDSIENLLRSLVELNEDQQNEIDLQLDQLKLPFTGLIKAFSGLADFLNDIKRHSAQYSTGAGFGNYNDISFGDSNYNVSSLSANVSSLSYDPTVYSYVPLYGSNEVVLLGGSVNENAVSGNSAENIEAPVFYMDFSLADSDIDYGGKVAAIDFSWYAKYKYTVDRLIVSFCWALFAWRAFKSLPSLIGGGDGVVSDVDPYTAKDNRFGRLVKK